MSEPVLQLIGYRFHCRACHNEFSVLPDQHGGPVEPVCPICGATDATPKLKVGIEDHDTSAPAAPPGLLNRLKNFVGVKTGNQQREGKT